MITISIEGAKLRQLHHKSDPEKMIERKPNLVIVTKNNGGKGKKSRFMSAEKNGEYLNSLMWSGYDIYNNIEQSSIVAVRKGETVPDGCIFRSGAMSRSTEGWNLG